LTGKLETVTDATGITRNTYDARDLLVQQLQPDGRSLAYEYDAAGYVSQMTAPSGATKYSYDSLGNVTRVESPSHQITSYVYDANGGVIRTELPDGSTEARRYNSTGHLTQIRTTRGAEVLVSFDYTLDAVGRRTTMTEKDGRKVHYTYDSLGRLTIEQINDLGNNRTIAYGYDNVSNRIQRDDSVDGLTSYSYDSNDRLLVESRGGIETKYNFDKNGNLLSRITSTTVQLINRWDAMGRLVESDATSGGTVVHVKNRYDAFGNRISQSLDGVEARFLVDTNRQYSVVLEEYKPNGDLIASYMHGLGVISQSRGNVISVYHPDAIGTVRALTNLSGVITDQYAFDAFGRELSRNGTTVNSYLYANEYRDDATGLDYLRARYYDASSGRFESEDPFPGIGSLPQTLHRYLYTVNDPVNHTDPSGLFPTLSGVMAAANAKTYLGVIQNIRNAAVLAKVDKYMTAFETIALFSRAGMSMAMYYLGGLSFQLATGRGFPVPKAAFAQVIFKDENANRKVFPKLEIRGGTNSSFERFLSLNIDLGSPGKLGGFATQGKFSGVYNYDRPEKSSWQVGANLIIEDIKNVMKIELAWRINVDPNVSSIRGGIEATFFGFEKIVLTLFDTSGEFGLL
jgi:RHS repeat-associated protein